MAKEITEVEDKGQAPDTDEAVDQEVEAVEDSEEFDAESAKKIIAELRKENAQRRVKQRALEDALKEAKSPEEYAAAVKAHGDSIHALERELVVTKFNLPETLAKRLAGTTREELEEDAKELAGLIVTEPEPEPELGGGLNPRGKDMSASVAAVVARRRKSHFI